MSTVNLIPASRRAARRHATQRRRWTVACSLYGLAIGTAWIALASHGGAASTAQARLADEQRRRDDAGRLLRQAQSQVQAATRTVEAAKVVRGNPNWGVVLRLVARALPDDMLLDRCAIKPITAAEAAAYPALVRSKPADKPDKSRPSQAANAPSPVVGYAVLIGGVAPNPTSATGYVLRLQECGLFDGVVLKEVRGRTVRGVDGAAFSVECLLAETVGGTR